MDATAQIPTQKLLWMMLGMSLLPSLAYLKNIAKINENGKPVYYHSDKMNQLDIN